MKNFLAKLKSSLPSAQQSLREEMNVQQVLVRSDKKGEVVLNDGTFASIYKTKLGHIALAQHPNEYIKIARLISYTVKIDDQPMSVEDALNLELGDFNRILEALQK